MHFLNYGLQKTWLDVSKNSRFREAFDRQHGQRTKTLLQYERQHRFNIF